MLQQKTSIECPDTLRQLSAEPIGFPHELPPSSSSRGDDAFQRDRRQMVALVHDHLSIAGDQVRDRFLSDKALDHRHTAL